MAESWDNFGILTKGLNLSETIEAFFEYANNNKSEQIFEEGLDYLLEKNELITGALISIEVMLVDEVVMQEPCTAIIKFAELEAFIDQADDDEIKEEVNGCINDLKEAYPEFFLILDEEKTTRA